MTIRTSIGPWSGPPAHLRFHASSACPWDRCDTKHPSHQAERLSSAKQADARVVEIASARGERSGGAYGLDDVVDGLAGCGGVGFVVSRDSWVVALATRWRLLVDSVAMWSCFCFHPASFPVSAVRTISGLPLRLVRDAACCIALFASTNSSMKLPRLRAVDALARASSWTRGGRLP